MFKYFGKNVRPFSAVCQNDYGRQIITTNQKRIDGDNILKELSKALAIHTQNAIEIEYLDRYYKGDQPILYRSKVNRPEINNRIVANMAYMIVETKTSEMAGEPIQYVLHGTDTDKSEEIKRLNEIMESEDKGYYDIELCRWRSICGTAYRFIGSDNGEGQLLDEADFFISTENPKKTFVCYYSNTGRPAFSCQIRKDEENRTIYFIYTNREWFEIRDDEIVASGINGNRAIPVIEYPNNSRRISDIEITITMSDEINKMASDRSNGIEQFVSAWVKFVNCEVDADSFKEMRQEGALVVKSNNGENKADVDILTSELNQTESQVAVSDTYEKMLVIQGMASRQENASGDTGSAVMLRNGHYDQEKRSELSEPVFIKSERMTLRIILNRLRITQGFNLMPSDVEVHISRTKMDNMLTKVECLQILLQSGVKYERAIKTVGLFSDPEQVAIESAKRMEMLYPDTESAADTTISSENPTDESVEVIENDNTNETDTD